jgi:hypothetical protein
MFAWVETDSAAATTLPYVRFSAAVNRLQVNNAGCDSLAQRHGRSALLTTGPTARLA